MLKFLKRKSDAGPTAPEKDDIISRLELRVADLEMRLQDVLERVEELESGTKNELSKNKEWVDQIGARIDGIENETKKAAAPISNLFTRSPLMFSTGKMPYLAERVRPER